MYGVNPVFIGFTGCLTLAFILSEYFYRIRYPRVLGYILSGIIISSTPLKDVLITSEFMPVLESLSEIGVVFLLLLVGAEINIKNLQKVSHTAVLTAFFSFILPLILGYITLLIFDIDPLTAFITGLCLSLSAEGIAVELLMEYGLLNTSAGGIIVEAGMIDDFLGVFALTTVISLSQGGLTQTVVRLPFEYIAFFTVSYLIGFRIFPQIARIIWRGKSRTSMFTLSIIFGMIIVIFSEVFELSALIGAFIAGLIINLTIKIKAEEKEIVESLKTVTFGFIIPFFFIWVGLNFELQKTLSHMPMIIALTLAATIGKFGGAYITGKIKHIRKKTVNLIAAGINTRGGIELIIASVARNEGLLPNHLFSMIVSVALITTIISPILFKSQVKESISK